MVFYAMKNFNFHYSQNFPLITFGGTRSFFLKSWICPTFQKRCGIHIVQHRNHFWYSKWILSESFTFKMHYFTKLIRENQKYWSATITKPNWIVIESHWKVFYKMIVLIYSAKLARNHLWSFLGLSLQFFLKRTSSVNYTEFSRTDFP